MADEVTQARSAATALDRDVRVIRRALHKLSDLDMYQLAKGDALAAEDALDRIAERLVVAEWCEAAATESSHWFCWQCWVLRFRYRILRLWA